jgi:predicted ATPase/DNA-binding CsgD family transcriptional regulator
VADVAPGWHTGRPMTTTADRALQAPTTVRAVDAVPGNLPIQLTSFVGRRAELDAVRELLARVRLVTLTGPGGAGKTRLAWQVAVELADRFPDGIWWIDLAELIDGAAVADAAATAIGVLVEPVRGPVRSLTNYLASRRALVCLDNAEHLLDDVARLVEAIVRSCPAVTLLVTSREPLGVPGEAVSRVPPLADDEAVSLFVERARLVRPGFTHDASSEEAVRSIALHLDGIPLALELAAAWLRTLTPQQIEAGLDDRFTLLVRGPRGSQRRQQTLAGSIDWSHALLDATDRVVFRRLAVFAGSFGLEGARAVCAGGPVAVDEVLPAIGRLVDKSLVVMEEHDGVARYRMLETMRAYATARLVEAREDNELRGRHLAWALEFAETTDAQRVADPDSWRGALRLEYANLRAALDRGLAAEDPEGGRRLAASLAWLWHLDRRGRDGIDYLRRAIDRTPEDRSRLQAGLLTGLALVADTADPLDLEYDAATRALELATELGDESLRALCLNLAAVGAFYTDFDAAWELCEQAHRAADAGGNGFVLGGSRALQAIILHLRDRHAEAEALVDETVRGHLQLHRGVLATVLGFHAQGALATGEPWRAVELAEEGLRIAEPLGDYLRVGAARSMLAYVRAMSGDLDGAQGAIEPILRLLDDGEDDVFVPGVGHTIGTLLIRRGDLATAIGWFSRDADSTDRGVETYLAGQALPGLGVALSALGRRSDAEAALDRAVAVARRLGMPGALAEALDGQAELMATDPNALERAVDLAHEALTERVAHHLRAFIPDSLETLARLGSQINPTAADARVLAASEAARESMGLPRGADRQAAYAVTTARLRECLGDAFEEAWSDGARLTLEDAVAYARRARGSRGRPSTGWASLTPTELEVIRLVADGMSNPKIGTRLFMSRGTVKTHLGHIFMKLDISNRTELARLATSHSLEDQG